jgi:hypothetical protein
MKKYGELTGSAKSLSEPVTPPKTAFRPRTSFPHSRRSFSRRFCSTTFPASDIASQVPAQSLGIGRHIAVTRVGDLWQNGQLIAEPDYELEEFPDIRIDRNDSPGESRLESR